MKRRFFLALYYGVAQFLPRSYMPGGRLGDWLRRACVKRLLAGFGAGSSIEPRVDLGSGRQLRLGTSSAIGSRSVVGTVTIGDNVMIGPELLAFSRNHNFEDVTLAPKYQGFADDQPISIGDDCWIGSRVTILPGVRIGTHCVVGAGSVVTKEVPDFSVVAGNPARVVKNLLDADAATASAPVQIGNEAAS